MQCCVYPSLLYEICPMKSLPLGIELNLISLESSNDIPLNILDLSNPSMCEDSS